MPPNKLKLSSKYDFYTNCVLYPTSVILLYLICLFTLCQYKNDLPHTHSHTHSVSFCETRGLKWSLGSTWFFRWHHCDRGREISCEAPLCVVSIVTWNFSFEIVLSFALFGQRLWEAPVLTDRTVKTTLHTLRWAQPHRAALVTHVAIHPTLVSQNRIRLWFRKDRQTFL